MSSWSKDFLLEFIELFRGQECLWKLTSKEYHNKNKREEAYKILVDKVKEIDKQADKQQVLKKINNLRCAFRKEMKKVHNLYSGMSADDVYKPKLWYYDYLLFLTDQEAPMHAKSSLSTDSDHQVRQTTLLCFITYNNFQYLLCTIFYVLFNVKILFNVLFL